MILQRSTSLDLRLAPMAAVTNAPFRLIARECGAGWLTSEELDALLEEGRRIAAAPRAVPAASSAAAG